MNLRMRTQAGFTLVEIVVVIVLLGILAAVAVPRFVNLQSDARASVLDGIQASIQGASVQIFAKALIQNQTGASGTVTTNLPTPNIDVINGYPAEEEIVNLINLDAQGVVVGGGTGTAVSVGYSGDADPTNEGCFLTYTEAAGGALPVYSRTVSSC